MAPAEIKDDADDTMFLASGGHPAEADIETASSAEPPVGSESFEPVSTPVHDPIAELIAEQERDRVVGGPVA